MPAKIILILAVLLFAYMLTRRQGGSEKQLALRRLLMVLFASLAIISILFPDITSNVAHLLGVGRGTDLILYGIVVAFLSYAATLYQRTSKLEAKITLLVRQLAILDAEISQQKQNADQKTE